MAVYNIPAGAAAGFSSSSSSDDSSSELDSSAFPFLAGVGERILEHRNNKKFKKRGKSSSCGSGQVEMSTTLAEYVILQSLSPAAGAGLAASSSSSELLSSSELDSSFLVGTGAAFLAAGAFLGAGFLGAGLASSSSSELLSSSVGAVSC